MKTDPYTTGMADHTIRGVPRVWVEGRSTLLWPLRRPISRRHAEQRRTRAFSGRSGAPQARATQSENGAEYTYSSVQQLGSTSFISLSSDPLNKTIKRKCQILSFDLYSVLS